MTPPDAAPEDTLNPVSSPRSGSKPLTSGWDIAVAALACSGLTTAFFQVWPGAVSSDVPPTAALLVKAALASLGFVAIATHWERALKSLVQDPSVLILFGLALASSLWAFAPSDALRDSLLLVLIGCFALGLALRFTAKDLSEIFAFAGVFAVAVLIVQPQAAGGIANLAVSGESLRAAQGDLAFALVAFGWAAFAVPARRNLWLTFLALGLIGAWRGGDIATLGAVCGACLGAGVMLVASAMRKGGGSSIVALAWLIVAAIAIMTAFALFGAAATAAAFENLMRALGASWALGNGFGAGGVHASGAIGEGLGLAGLLAALLVVTTGFVRVLWASRTISAAPVVWMAMLGALVCAPSEIAMTGPCVVMLLSAGFALSPVRSAQTARPPLVLSARRAAQDPLLPTPRYETARPVATVQPQSVKGLRPRL